MNGNNAVVQLHGQYRSDNAVNR